MCLMFGKQRSRRRNIIPEMINSNDDGELIGLTSVLLMKMVEFGEGRGRMTT